MAGSCRPARESTTEEAIHVTTFGPAARASLALMIISSLIFILMGVFLIWIALTGYKNLDLLQRTIALGMGAAVGIGFSLLLALLLRQQIAGLPRVRATAPGLAVGSTVIPWVEIDEIGAVSLFALPHLGILQLSTAPKRLRGIRSIQYMPMGDRRMLFLAARQVGTNLEWDLQRTREAWSRARSIAADT